MDGRQDPARRRRAAVRIRGRRMEFLIWAGAAISVAGLAGLVWCIIYVMRLRKLGLDDQTMRARMQRAVLINFAALAVSTIGLMMVIAGIFLT